MENEKGGGFKYTFGDSMAAVNLTSNILEKQEFRDIRHKVARLLTKQIIALKSLMAIRDKRMREASLKMWHDEFPLKVSDLPELVRTHVLCVETGIYRQLLRDSKKQLSGKTIYHILADYICEQCSTPNFVNLVIPLKTWEQWQKTGINDI
ncbi:MAG: hypothetical protein MUP17_00250 [candidate division Zixibacteria bacterium]|nr:hypothetical protein [candidate division Zixibacteria bacterium]